MKITFIIPPANGKAPDRNFGCNYGITFQAPVHLLYPAAILENEKHSVKFIDCPVEKINEQQFEEFLQTDDSDVFVFFTVYLAKNIDIQAAHRINIYHKKKPKIIFFGPEPTREPELFIKEARAFVVRGEPEDTMKELINSFENKTELKEIKGLSFEDENFEIQHNPTRALIQDLDKIPFPARHLLQHPEKYINAKLKSKPCTTMLTSRGCYGQCIYCIPCAYSFCAEIEYKKWNKCKPPVRARSAGNILEEFKEIKKQGYKSVAIMDDNFMCFSKMTTGRDRLRILFGLLGELNIEWGCLARADDLQDEELLQEMKFAGCRYVDIGVESFDQKILDYVNKGSRAGDVFNAIFLLKKVGIEPKLNILLGCSPNQTEEDIEWTIEVLKILKPDTVSFGIVTPHPSTEYYQKIKEGGWFVNNDWKGSDPYKESEISLPNLNQEKLQKLIRWCYKEYYLRPAYFIQVLKNTKSLDELLKKIKIAWRLFT